MGLALSLTMYTGDEWLVEIGDTVLKGGSKKFTNSQTSLERLNWNIEHVKSCRIRGKEDAKAVKQLCNRLKVIRLQERCILQFVSIWSDANFKFFREVQTIYRKVSKARQKLNSLMESLNPNSALFVPGNGGELVHLLKHFSHCRKAL